VKSVEDIEIIRVKFFGQGVSAFDQNGLDLHIGDYCITEDSDDNENLGMVIGKVRIQKRKSTKPIPKILRKANEEDIRIFEENTRKEAEAHEICKRKIEDRELPMKLVKTRYSPDSRKITFYFTSERRVDFRELVKDLAYIFKRRIELRQIGVRDEAKMCGGFGCCGRQLCCTSFLKKLGRLSIKMAKEQDMTLTPSKISGVCGRLLCCLQYENDWYHEVKQDMPELSSKIEVDNIKGKVEQLDIFHNTVKVRDDNGILKEIDVEDLPKKEKIKGEGKSSHSN
jgi:cell fate regulator YaaT (PSP1 superfamily)